MFRKVMFVPLLAALLAAGQGVAAAATYYDQEVRFERPTIEDIRATLQGPRWTGPPSSPFPRPGLLADGRPFRARFTEVMLSPFDMPRLAAIVENAASLPPDSLVEIQGRMDGDPFMVTIQSDRFGRREARLEGLVFRDRYEALHLLDGLTRRGVQYARLDGRVGFQHIGGWIENGITRFEG